MWRFGVLISFMRKWLSLRKEVVHVGIYEFKLNLMRIDITILFDKEGGAE
jgi:hypothetical protein